MKLGHLEALRGGEELGSPSGPGGLRLRHGVGVREKHVHFRPGPHSLPFLGPLGYRAPQEGSSVKDSGGLMAQDWRVQPGWDRHFLKGHDRGPGIS